MVRGSQGLVGYAEEEQTTVIKVCGFWGDVSKHLKGNGIFVTKIPKIIIGLYVYCQLLLHFHTSK